MASSASVRRVYPFDVLARPHARKKPKKDPRHLSAAGQIGRSRFSVLQVQGVTKRPQCGFLDRFAQGWMGMDGARDIFQASAHFQ